MYKALPILCLGKLGVVHSSLLSLESGGRGIMGSSSAGRLRPAATVKRALAAPAEDEFSSQHPGQVAHTPAAPAPAGLTLQASEDTCAQIYTDKQTHLVKNK